MPTAILTPRAVLQLALEPGRGRTVYLDQHPDSPRGFALRVSRTSRSYYVLVRLHGRRRWLRLGDAAALSLDDARRAARILVGQVAAGRDPTQDRRAARAQELAAAEQARLEAGGWTLADLVGGYITARQDRLSRVTWTEYRRSLAHDVAPAPQGRLLAREVVRDDVRALLRRIARRAPRQAARVLALLRSSYRWGQDEEQVVVGPAGERLVRTRVDRDPTRRVEQDLNLPLRATKRERHLSEQEIPLWWRGLGGLPAQAATLARLVLLVGTRRGETYRARWAEFDLDAGSWLIPAEHRKGRIVGPGIRRPLLVPLPSQAVTLLRDLKLLVGGTHPFRRGLGLGTVGGRMKVATGIDVTIHDLRRSCVSGLQRMGCPPHVLSAVLGHHREAGSTATDAHYTHGGRLTEHRLWLERFSAHVERLVSGRPADVVPFPVAGVE